MIELSPIDYGGGHRAIHLSILIGLYFKKTEFSACLKKNPRMVWNPSDMKEDLRILNPPHPHSPLVSDIYLKGKIKCHKAVF